MESFMNFIPTKFFFGVGELDKLGEVALPGKKALVVISSGKSVRKTGTLDRVLRLLKQNGVSFVIFDKIQPNPILAQVTEGAQVSKTEKCDFVLGLGGGSSIDSAKAIAVMATNPGNYWDYIGSGSGKAQPLQKTPLPIVAITTTAGTGTEVDPWCVITNGNEKIGFGCEGTFPTLAIIDPELMKTVPPKLTAYQGFDALFHASEGFLSKMATPISEAYSLKSIELIFKSLPAAIADGNNMEARTGMAMANTISGMVESTSTCGSEHSLAHAISGLFPNVPHGAALIMVSLAWFKFFSSRLPDRFVAMGKAAGHRDFMSALKSLQLECDVIGLQMSDFGIGSEDLKKINDNAWETMGKLFDVDRVKMTRADSLDIYMESYR